MGTHHNLLFGAVIVTALVIGKFYIDAEFVFTARQSKYQSCIITQGKCQTFLSLECLNFLFVTSYE